MLIVIHRKLFIQKKFEGGPQDEKAKREQLWPKMGMEEENWTLIIKR